MRTEQKKKADRGGQTTLDGPAAPMEPGTDSTAGKAGPAEKAELGSDFARQFWEMDVDREAFRNYYLIQEHAARRLHWDLRLEKDRKSVV